jgi:uncharacterized protein with PIN domain
VNNQIYEFNWLECEHCKRIVDKMSEKLAREMLEKIEKKEKCPTCGRNYDET